MLQQVVEANGRRPGILDQALPLASQEELKKSVQGRCHGLEHEFILRCQELDERTGRKHSKLSEAWRMLQQAVEASCRGPRIQDQVLVLAGQVDLRRSWQES